jgi:signal peptidase I
MEPTFQDGNYILIDEISYRFNTPQRGDIIVFRYPVDQTQFFIKRVIGLPGETVKIANDKVTIFNGANPNGFLLDETAYLPADQLTDGTYNVKLDPNEYFVMGDNREHSSDSRFWGPVNVSLITGRVFFRAYPVQEVGGFPKPGY